MPSKEELLEQFNQWRSSSGRTPWKPRQPDRQSNFGSDVYIALPDDNWQSIAIAVYGDASYASKIQRANRGYTTVTDGLKLILPDREYDPIVPTDNEDFWNTPEFGHSVNAMDYQQRGLIPEYTKAETIWPEHGERVFIGFDENNDPFPTTDPSGLPMFWDRKERTWAFEDTGIPYTMGMMQNDFIKPLSIEEKVELTMLGEQKFSSKAMAYYAQAAQSEQFKSEVGERQENINFRTTHPIDQDSEFVRTLHGEKQAVPTSMRWWESALDSITLFEEGFRGASNVALREGESGREGYNPLERTYQVVAASAQSIGAMIGSGWTGVRSFFAGLFGEELKPYAVDIETMSKLTPDELEQRISDGRGASVKYFKPSDYWSLEVDRATTTALRWIMTGYDGHFMGIYRDEFDSQEEYEDYIGNLYAFYEDGQDEALKRNLETQRQEEGTRLEARDEMEGLMEAAFAARQENDGEGAQAFMLEAMNLQTRAAHWYSPYFMWSNLNESWRNEAFLEAAAQLTLANGEPLEPRVVRDLRRRYEHPGADIVMGIIFDVLNLAPALRVFRGAAKLPTMFANTVADLGISTKMHNLKPIRPVIRALEWFTGEAFGSAGTRLRRQVNQMAAEVARGVDASIGQPGVRGLDEELELLFRGIQEDPELLLQLGANARSPLQIKNAQRAIQMFDPASELSAMRQIDPVNIKQLVQKLRDEVWSIEYKRAARDLAHMAKGPNPEWTMPRLAAEAARIADSIASKPNLIARHIGPVYEDAFRALHRTNLGPSTLDDNIFIEFGKLTGTREFLENNLKGIFKYYYAVRNGLFEWWLGLRPAWFSINVQDSIGRATISGMKMLDDTGYVSILNRERLLGSNMIREEFTTSIGRAVQEVGTSIVRADPIVDKWLRGRKFKLGPLSHVAVARQDMLLERAAVRAGQSPTGPGGKAIRWLIDQYKIGKGMLSKGNMDASTMLEFGLRQRTFATHYDKAFDVMDSHNLEVVSQVIRDMGGTDETVAVFRKVAAAAGDDAEKLSTLLTVRDPSLRGTGRPRLYSEILPDNFEEVLEAMLIDRRLRTLLFRPMVETLEPMVKAVNSTNVESTITKIDEFYDNVVRGINEEFVADAYDFTPQPRHVDEAAGARAAEASAPVDADDARQVNIGSENEGLEVTVEQLRMTDNTVRGFGPEYHARGALQEESMARLGDLERELEQAARDLAVEGASAADVARQGQILDIRRYTQDVRSRLSLARDRTKNFLKFEFPGPLRKAKGHERDVAWQVFERIGEQVYDSIIAHTDAAIDWATTAFRSLDDKGVSLADALEIPSIDNLLRTAGLELTYDGTRLSTFQISDDLIGRTTIFSGEQVGNYMKIQLTHSFFGPRVTLRNAAEWFQRPFTTDLVRESNELFTRAERAEELAARFGEDIGRATDQAINEADEAWQAVVNSADMGGGLSLRQRWGTQATATRQGFIEFLTEEIELLRQMGVNEESIGAVQHLLDEIHSVGITIEQLTDPIAVHNLVPRPIPSWMLDEGIQTWSHAQRNLSAERSGVTRAIRQWQEWLVNAIRTDAVNLRPLDPDQARILSDISVQAVDRKTLARTLAADGTKKLTEALDAPTSRIDDTIPELVTELNRAVMGNDEPYKGAVNITQFDMLEYGENYRFDNIMKFISPFWMFQSRSPLFWIKTFAQDPRYLSWFSRYTREQRKKQIEAGATDSAGRPLNRLFGYFRMPGSQNWIAPLNSSSSRYVTPRPSPFPSEFDKDADASQIALTYMFEYGQMFGFRPAPWITYPMYAKGWLDPNRLPIGGIISHTGLIPPYWQRDMRRALNIMRYPNDPGLWAPEVGWQDFLIHKEMLGLALIELTENPDSLPTVRAELYEAFGYDPGELGDYGEPLDYRAVDINYYRESPRWTAARDKLENTQWKNQWGGFLTGVYPKEYSDAEGALLALRDDMNFLQQSINSISLTPIFALDPVAETRAEMYDEKQYGITDEDGNWVPSAEGFIDQMYGFARWTQLDGGGQAYGEDRIDIMAKRVWENEVTAAYYDSVNLMQDQLDACQKANMMGSNAALGRACHVEFFQGLAYIDDLEIFDIARKGGTVGYKTEAVIQERFSQRWWRYLNSSYPKWFQEDGEDYTHWQERVEVWLDDLPALAAELAAVFHVQEVAPKTGDYETGEGTEIPGSRRLIEENLLNNLIKETTRDGYLDHRKKNDSAYDAMNEAWKALRWDPYQEMIAGQDEMNSYEKEQVEEAFLKKYGPPPELAEMQRWVMENYDEDQFTAKELSDVFHGSGVSSMEERLLPTTERGAVGQNIWETLGTMGPGENYKIFEEEFILAGGDPGVLDTWYNTGGHIDDFEMVEELQRRISMAAAALDVGQPSQGQLVEWSTAKNLNDDFSDGIAASLGEDFYSILGTWGALPRGVNKDAYEEIHQIVIDQYFDAKEWYAGEHQLWAKYYYPKFYEGGVGIPGEGVEGRPGGGDGGGGGGGGGGGRSSSQFAPLAKTAERDIVPAGYRSTLNAKDLYSRKVRLGSGGFGGQPYWPVGFGKGKPKKLLKEIVEVFEKDKPLTNPAIEYLKNQEPFEEYIKELLEYSGKLGGGGSTAHTL